MGTGDKVIPLEQRLRSLEDTVSMLRGELEKVRVGQDRVRLACYALLVVHVPELPTLLGAAQHLGAAAASVAGSLVGVRL